LDEDYIILTYVVTLFKMCGSTTVLAPLEEPTTAWYPSSTFWGSRVILGGRSRAQRVWHLMETC